MLAQPGSPLNVVGSLFLINLSVSFVQAFVLRSWLRLIYAWRTSGLWFRDPHSHCTRRMCIRSRGDGMSQLSYPRSRLKKELGFLSASAESYKRMHSPISPKQVGAPYNHCTVRKNWEFSQHYTYVFGYFLLEATFRILCRILLPI